MACPAVTFCAIVDSTGNALAWRSGTWLTPQAFGTTDGSGGQTSIDTRGRVGLACPSTSDCTAVIATTVARLGRDGVDRRAVAVDLTVEPGPRPSGHGGGLPHHHDLLHRERWRRVDPERYRRVGALDDIDPGGGLDAISCPTSSFCLAADGEGREVTWNGSNWSAPVRVLPAETEYTGGDTSLSCPSADFCLVIDADGAYTTWSGPPGADVPDPSSTTTTTSGGT